MFFNSCSEININYFELLKPSEVDKSINPNFKANLYFILGIPRWFFSGYPRKLLLKKGKLCLKLVSDENSTISIPIIIVDDNEEPIKIEKMELSRDERFLILNGNIQYSAIDFMLNYKNFCPGFEILYIGQSQGKKRSRTVNDRLVNHRTLQKIMSDVDQGILEYEIRILTFSIKEEKIATTLGDNIFQDNLSYEEIDKIISDKQQLNYYSEKILKEMNEFPSLESQINIVEAKLINYFKPRYNVTFKNGSVPNRNHSSYRDYFKQHFNSMIINLSEFVNHSSFLDCTLFTDSVSFNPGSQVIDYAIEGNENSFDSIVSYIQPYK